MQKRANWSPHGNPEDCCHEGTICVALSLIYSPTYVVSCMDTLKKSLGWMWALSFGAKGMFLGSSWITSSSGFLNKKESSGIISAKTKETIDERGVCYTIERFDGYKRERRTKLKSV